jgi:hypothetical protein
MVHISFIRVSNISIKFCVALRPAGSHRNFLPFYVIKHYCDQLPNSPRHGLPEICQRLSWILHSLKRGFPDPPRPLQIPKTFLLLQIISLSSLHTLIDCVKWDSYIPHIWSIVDRVHISYIRDSLHSIRFCVALRPAGSHRNFLRFYVIKHYCGQLPSSPRHGSTLPLDCVKEGYYNPYMIHRR